MGNAKELPGKRVRKETAFPKKRPRPCLERRLEEKEIVKLPDDFATLMTTCPTVTDPSVASYIDFLWRGWRRSVEEKAVLEIRCYFINEELRNMRKEALRE